MKYLKVKWKNESDSEDNPIWLYSEIDNKQLEIRKVDIYSDGHSDFADENNSNGETFISDTPIPDLAEINIQDEFEGLEITEKEFNVIWDKAVYEKVKKDTSNITQKSVS